MTGEDVAIIAVPSYGGLVPATAAQRLSQLKGNGARAVLLVVYGNRAYEDTLVELEDLAQKAGFTVIAGAVAVAEHSILRQYAAGRPNEADHAALKKLGAKVRQKLEAGEITRPTLPGNRPYKKAGGGAMVPKANNSCTQCGTCAARCPVGAIDPADPKVTDKKKCIGCMRCVAICPAQARAINKGMAAVAGLALKKACSVPKECELYL